MAAQTVLGVVDPEALGRTLMHEHIYVDYSPNFKLGDLPAADWLDPDGERSMWEGDLQVEDAAHCRCFFSQSADNMRLSDAGADVAADLRRFKDAGGGTVVECTIEGIKAPDHAQHLREFSRKVGLNVVMGTGYYLARTHPSGMDARTVEELTEKFLADLQGAGVDGSGIRAGIIGELGVTTRMHPNERKVLQAAARAQKKVGCAISVHPGYSVESPSEICDVLEAAGADLRRVVIGHVDRGILSLDDMKSLASRGVVLEFDQFGWGCSFQHALRYDIEYPSDFQRCRQIKALIDAGFGEQVVVSHDIAFKSRLSKFGGHTYDYLSRFCTPFMKKRCGLSDEELALVFEGTPRRLLTIPGLEAPAQLPAADTEVPAADTEGKRQAEASASDGGKRPRLS